MNEFKQYCDTIAFSIKSARRLQGLTQEQLAERVNLSSEYISRLERGVNLPSLKTVYRISKVLDLEENILFYKNKKESGVNVVCLAGQ